MDNLIVTENIEIQLTDFSGTPVLIENIAVYIKTKARRKNDFNLGPFFSDKNGIIRITKTDFLNEVDATYDSGLMDYSSIESNHPKVEIKPYTEDEINKMIQSRTNIWTSLLKGETQRWESIDSLIDSLKKTTNELLDSNKNDEVLVANLNGEKDNLILNMKIKTKPNNVYSKQGKSWFKKLLGN